ncbi:hypothetical protein APSETT445_000579 [Aspergillus pseudonomiae]
MVGIGGGAPSEKVDIRLGDVVVSNPTRDFGGVIQYDYGKTVSGGRFERTGVLNKPLPVLLTAVSRLKAAHMSMPNKIPSLLSEMLVRNPMMRKSFTYRGADQDLLFDSEYDHCGSENTCDNCDKTRLVTRPARLTYDPIIHYGLIASGNQVVKHGRTRDKLAREIGILCFEMEAAGLMDDFQCLVIRGICDYSDSHKNKQWQQYAAATAAAYAKELLSVVHTSQVVDTPPSRSDCKLGVQVTEIVTFQLIEDPLVSYYNGKLPFGGEHATSVTVRRNDVKTEIRKFFGPKPIQPDFEDLKYIFSRLFHSVPDAVYIIDGLDVLSQNHGKALLGLIQSLFCFSRPPQGSRILLLSRDQVPGYINIATFMPGIRQISTSGNVMEDIESYIEASIIDKTMCRKLTDDAVLVEDIKRTLLTKSSGIVKVNAVSKSLCTPLWLAASNGHREVVSLLVEHQSNIEAKGGSPGQTALSQAARNGHYGVVELLLEKGADLESKDIDGRTPLSWAVKYRHEAIMKLLLEKGAEPKSQDIDVPSLVLWASGNGYEVVLKLLVDKGVYLETKDNRGRTPLFFAVQNGNEAVINLLIDGGADLETKDISGGTPLIYAAENGHEEVVKLLVDRGAYLEAKDSRGGLTPLSLAAGNGHEAVVKLLIDRGADLEAKNTRGGRTPLSWAAGNGHEAVVKLLIDRGADLETQEFFGQRPLFCAVEHGHEAVVKLLVDKGADRNAKDIDGETLLSLAARRGHDVVVEFLRSHDTLP